MSRANSAGLPQASGLLATLSLLLCPVVAQATTIAFTDKATFEAASGSLTLIDFDVDSDGNAISAPPPGILAGALFAGDGITFSAGVLFSFPGVPSPISPPNWLTNSGVNTPTPALVDASFSSPVFEVGLTNFGAAAQLRIFDASDALIATLNSDSNSSASDFVGLISDTPIYRLEYDYVSGVGFNADDLLFTASSSTVPEPTTLLLLSTGLAAGAWRRFKKHG